jgi:hypothetical protein
MEFCLDCHRAPEKYLRPRESVFDVQYQPPTAERPVVVGGEEATSQLELGRLLKTAYGVADVPHMTSCSVCHR